MFSFHAFSKLPTELQQEVAKQCDLPNQLHLACASHELQSLVIPMMYRDVNLSYHNDEGLFSDLHYQRMVFGNNPQRNVRGLVFDSMQAKQQLFIHTLINNPSYGAYVAHFTWTYAYCCVDEAAPFETKESDEAEQRMWKAFLAMTKVKSVDICSMDREMKLVVPPPLFHTATRIKIGGRVTYAFFRAVLSHPQIIEELNIDNVQSGGQLADGQELDNFDDLSSMHETEGAESVPILRHPGPMRAHLHLITGLCGNLRHLSISTVGQDDYPDERWLENRERERYEEIARFIESVVPKLETLTLEYGMEPDMEYRRPCRGEYDAEDHIGRPMDRRFLSLILPTLCQSPWPELRNMQIRGIGSVPRQVTIHRMYEAETPSTFLDARDRLRAALNAGTNLIWEEKMTRSFYLFEYGC